MMGSLGRVASAHFVQRPGSTGCMAACAARGYPSTRVGDQQSACGALGTRLAMHAVCMAWSTAQQRTLCTASGVMV